MAARKLRILVGVDFSKASLRALRTARALAERVGGSLTVAHVRSPSNVTAAAAEERGDLIRGPAEKLSPALQKHYEARLAPLRPQGGWTILLRGVPSRALCKEAGRGYDLLVLGTRGRGRVATFLLGSTVQDALGRSPIPILVTR